MTRFSLWIRTVLLNNFRGAARSLLRQAGCIAFHRFIWFDFFFCWIIVRISWFVVSHRSFGGRHRIALRPNATSIVNRNDVSSSVHSMNNMIISLAPWPLLLCPSFADYSVSPEQPNKFNELWKNVGGGTYARELQILRCACCRSIQARVFENKEGKKMAAARITHK